MTRARAWLLASGPLILAACHGGQHPLDPASPQSRAIANLFWVMLAIAAAVYVVVLALFGYASLHGRRTRPDPERPTVIPTHSDRTLARWVGGGVAITVLILVAVLIAELGVSRVLSANPARMMTIDVIGRQWWWEITYADADPSKVAKTANEIHVPVGVPVQLRLASRDVIHSLWIPNLRGKKDLVPGYVTNTWFVADTPGVYRGQCAEFCGHQHAKMALYVVAEPRDAFDRWLEAQRQPALPPQDSLAKVGRQVFMSGACSNCHAIGGEPAYGTVGPDLTHLASRRSIAAGVLPNTRGHRAGWIVDPQSIKPGARMPSNQLGANQLQALLAYLETLK